MKFGEYVKRRRESLHLNQDELDGFGQSYVSAIENGRKQPTKRDTLAQLARVLQLPESRIDWLWTYSLLNKDPDECFGQKGRVLSSGSLYANDAGLAYEAGHADEIHEGMMSSSVAVILGKPDRVVKFGEKEKWLYEEIGIHILFEAGKVVDVVFK